MHIHLEKIKLKKRKTLHYETIMTNENYVTYMCTFGCDVCVCVLELFNIVAR